MFYCSTNIILGYVETQYNSILFFFSVYKEETMYEKSRCSQTINGKPCPYEPIRKCGRCGKLICMEHSNEMRSPNSGADWNAYNGIFCPPCEEIIRIEHDQYLKQVRTKQNLSSASNMACSCADECCKAGGPLVNYICDFRICT